MTLLFRTYSEAWQLNERVTADCIRNGEWSDGTNNYCNPTQNANGQWEVPILEGYEKYFTLAEISRAQNPDWFSVTRWQLRAQLAIQGLEDSVTTAINGLPSSTQTETEFKIKAQYAWDYSNNIERNSPTVAMIQAVLSLTDSEVDDIFIDAYAIDI